jgi:hypothetical protein
MTPAPATSLDTASVPRSPGRRLGMGIVLFALAAPETLDGLSNISTLLGVPGPFGIPTLFGNTLNMPGPGIGGFLVKVHIAVHPVLALAALLLAAMGKVRGAIVALGSVIVIRCLSYMPEVVEHGLVLAPGPLVALLLFVLSLLAAACAISCALHNERLGLATLLLSVPVLFNLFLVILSIGAPDSGCG